ncbi:MAG TPA: methyltransferase domain-containing protein, partial [Conexibacter sp.]|nr:methyltransferase domain-containing protein [Conexibacter sp.]
MISRSDPVWCCPSCRGALIVHEQEARMRCGGCDARYGIYGGVPDLRVDRPAWIDIDEDRDAAARLERDHRSKSLEDMIRAVFGAQAGRSQHQVDMRTRQVLASPGRLTTQLDGWLRSATRSGFLDLGCGPGMLLAAAAGRGASGLGIDVSLLWLVVARRMIAEHGGRATLCAGFAESLPLRDASVPAIVSLDVIEHVADQRRYLAEIDRIAADGATLALATPNRFSLSAEPHVHVWGVGWLPARFQARYVFARSGRPYEFVRLLSVPGLARLLRRHTRIRGRFLVPPVPDEEIESYHPRRARLAR